MSHEDGRLHLKVATAQSDLRRLARQGNAPRLKYGPTARLLAEIREAKDRVAEAKANLDEHHAINGCSTEEGRS